MEYQNRRDKTMRDLYINFSALALSQTQLPRALNLVFLGEERIFLSLLIPFAAFLNATKAEKRPRVSHSTYLNFRNNYSLSTLRNTHSNPKHKRSNHTMNKCMNKGQKMARERSQHSIYQISLTAWMKTSERGGEKVKWRLRGVPGWPSAVILSNCDCSVVARTRVLGARMPLRDSASNFQQRTT